MTDAFTTAARAAAERDWGTTVRAQRPAFIAGARWAWYHLAAQAPTEEEVEAAKAVLDAHEYADEPQAIRDALTAARAARRDEKDTP